MAHDLYTDADGNGLRRLRIPPVLHDERKMVFIDRLQLDVEAGLGLTSGQGSDPQITIRMSKTGGKTWGNLRSRDAGVHGAYDQRAIWHRCGAGRAMVPEISASDPIAHRWLDLYADVRQGSA